jgi:hypothetical protein
MLCQMLAVGISFVAFTLYASAKARDGADEGPFRENAAKFHLNFSAGEFDRNGPLVTPDVEVDSNNVKFAGCENFVKLIENSGMQLRDHPA